MLYFHPNRVPKMDPPTHTAVIQDSLLPFSNFIANQVWGTLEKGQGNSEDAQMLLAALSPRE